jgi:hypothetical protein
LGTRLEMLSNCKIVGAVRLHVLTGGPNLDIEVSYLLTDARFIKKKKCTAHSIPTTQHVLTRGSGWRILRS